MTKVLLPLAAALLAAGLSAQVATTSALTATGRFAVQADAGKAVNKVAPAGAILRPVLLEARDLGAARGHFAYAKMQLGLYGAACTGPRPGLKCRPGGYLLNIGNVAAPATLTLTAQAKALGQVDNFDWAFKTGKELNGKVLIFFEGHIFGGAQIKAQINTRVLDPQIRQGRFALKGELPIAKAREIKLNFGMVADTNQVDDGKASYHGHLYFYFVPEPVQPTFQWVRPPQQAKNCAAGQLVDPSPITPGVPFDIELSGATDIGAPPRTFAMLFIGSTDQNLFFIPLPFDLSSIGGATSAGPCLLFIDIHGQRPAKLENGAAKLPFSIPRGLYFREIYFQWAYTSSLTAGLGLVFTDYAKLVRQ